MIAQTIAFTWAGAGRGGVQLEGPSRRLAKDAGLSNLYGQYMSVTML